MKIYVKHRRAQNRIMPGRRRLAAGVLAAVSGVCLGVGAGAVPAVAVPAAPAVAVKAAVPKGLESFYGQRVEWYDCGATGGMEKSAEATAFKCAKVKVPLDYSQPDGQTIEIAMKKHVATGSIHRGSLFINPGGPGGSGVQYVEAAAETGFAGVQGSYDIIGFDPRGVGSSTPITCATANGADPAGGADQAPNDAAFEELAPQITTSFSQMEADCAANTKPAGLLDHVDTITVARDLDILRALSGNEKLDYAGFSYGTYLGAHYAELFPSNTGRMVLDGAMDPSLTLYESRRGQVIGFEHSLRTYVEWCQGAADCPLSGGTDAGVQQISDLFSSADQSPLPTSDPNRSVTGTDIKGVVTQYMYFSEQDWPVLNQALTQAIVHHDGSMIRSILDRFQSAGSNSTLARLAINCLDYQVEGDMTSWAARDQEMEQVAPHFGQMAVISDLACQSWGHTGTQPPKALHAKGAAPILVIGTTGDPATPYEWAKALAGQLESGQLLTWEGNGHTAYANAGHGPCITKAVDTYLLTGTMPKKDLTCRGKE